MIGKQRAMARKLRQAPTRVALNAADMMKEAQEAASSGTKSKQETLRNLSRGSATRGQQSAEQRRAMQKKDYNRMLQRRDQRLRQKRAMDY